MVLGSFKKIDENQGHYQRFEMSNDLMGRPSFWFNVLAVLLPLLSIVSIYTFASSITCGSENLLKILLKPIKQQIFYNLL